MKTALKTCFLLFITLSVLGCSDAFRFAPSESQKQSAQLTHELAVTAQAQGIQPESPAADKLSAGTLAALNYIGLPKTPPDIGRFEAVTNQAISDSVKRPSPADTAGNFLDLAIAIAGLVGGVGGTKIISVLSTLKSKAKALEEVVAGNELFKKEVAVTAGVLQTFKDSQNENQTLTTSKIVAQLKA